uniref:Uncharacterized protein n=1 Tax=Ditylenchus dipsaci TaxID=166011 RepID=A0A915CVK5_9BILA
MDGEEEANLDMYGERNSEKEMQTVVQSTGNATCWLRSWMRLLCLMDPTQPSRSQATVQTFSRTMELLLRVGCANTLIHWLSQRLLRLQISQQPHAIAPLCSVLTKAQPPELVRAHILYHLLNCLRSEAAPLVLEQIPQMALKTWGYCPHQR